MCKILDKYKESKTFTGYKIVARVGKRIYSPFTGIEYKKGKIPFIEMPQFTRNKWAKLSGNLAYRDNYAKRTSVIVDINTAAMLKTEFSYAFDDELEIVKMTLSKDLHRSKGYWGDVSTDIDYEAITGSYIDKIETLK